MYDRSEQINELAAALCNAQAAIKSAELDSVNPHFKSKYASLGSIIAACREPLSANGIAVLQPPATTDDGQVRVTTVLMHTSGQFIECGMTASASGRGGATVQQMGSVITYLRRYTLASLVGVYAGDDDDGNAVSTQAHVNGKQKRRPQSQPQPSQNGKPADDIDTILSDLTLANGLIRYSSLADAVVKMGIGYNHINHVLNAMAQHPAVEPDWSPDPTKGCAPGAARKWVDYLIDRKTLDATDAAEAVAGVVTE